MVIKIPFLFIFFIIKINCYPTPGLTKIALVRGESDDLVSLNNYFGWTDVSLSQEGQENAEYIGGLLYIGQFKFDVCYTSLLKRSVQTAFHILNKMNQLHIPIYKDYHLNERHYGVLEGDNKKEAKIKYGIDIFKHLRKSFEFCPPKFDENDEKNPSSNEKYKNIPKKDLPNGESIKDLFERVIPYFFNVIIPNVKQKKNVLIVAHEETLRIIDWLLMHNLQKISEEEYISTDVYTDYSVSTNNVLFYELDDQLKSIKKYYWTIYDVVSQEKYIPPPL